MGPLNTETVLVHELFHAVQANYKSQPRWIREGQAQFMQDEVFNAHDDLANNGFVIRSNMYLSDPNRFTLTSILQRDGYEAVWFWKYFAERFGTLPDPGQGVDAMRVLLETGTNQDVTGIEAVTRTLNLLAPGVTFQDVWEDFLIANYARKLPGADIPEKYRFADELEPLPGPLQDVHLDVDHQLFDAHAQIGPLLADVKPWGARYYRLKPTNNVPIFSFHLNQHSTNPIFHALPLRSRQGPGLFAGRKPVVLREATLTAEMEFTKI